MNFIYFALVVLCHDISASHDTNIKTQYQWKQLVFTFPSIGAEQQANKSGNFKPENALPIDVQPYYNRTKNIIRTFVTIPRFGDGIPYTLATVAQVSGPNGPLLEPYPNYEAHNNNDGRNCDAISSAFRVAITECNQMWVIDRGSSNGECRPQLLLFNLDNDKLIHRYRFEKHLYTNGSSLLANPIADVRDLRLECRNTMIYVADVNNFGLVVYDYWKNKAWRIEHPSMAAERQHSNLTIAGESFQLMDGIFGMATDKNKLYFHALASLKEYSVPLYVIDAQDRMGSLNESIKILGERFSPCAASAMDSNNNLYCVTLNPIQLLKWNVHTPYKNRYIQKLPINPEELQFVSGMKVVKNYKGYEELWMISNRFQKMAAGTQNFNETNFRILTLPLMTKNSKACRNRN